MENLQKNMPFWTFWNPQIVSNWFRAGPKVQQIQKDVFFANYHDKQISFRIIFLNMKKIGMVKTFSKDINFDDASID